MSRLLSRSCLRHALLVAFVPAIVSVAVPAFGQVTVTGPMLLERNAIPGETYQGAITLRNTSMTVQTVTLAMADYTFDAAGSNTFGEPGSHRRSNTAWIVLSQRTVAVPPQATQSVGYTITVPAEATSVDGTYWGVVLIETEDRSAPAEDKSTFTIRPRLRYAVQLITHLGNTGVCTLGFGAPAVQTGRVTVDLTGAGTRACRPTLKLEVYDASGALRHTTTKAGNYLYPTTSTRHAFDLATLTPGDYTFLIVADVGADRLQGARFQVAVK